MPLDGKIVKALYDEKTAYGYKDLTSKFVEYLNKAKPPVKIGGKSVSYGEALQEKNPKAFSEKAGRWVYERYVCVGFSYFTMDDFYDVCKKLGFVKDYDDFYEACRRLNLIVVDEECEEDDGWVQV